MQRYIFPREGKKECNARYDGILLFGALYARALLLNHLGNVKRLSSACPVLNYLIYSRNVNCRIASIGIIPTQIKARDGAAFRFETVASRGLSFDQAT